MLISEPDRAARCTRSTVSLRVALITDAFAPADSASFRISLATTANPRPASPAWAASIAAFADTFSTEFGALDVLVNNAAIAFKGADPTPFEGQTGPTLRTNYKGTVALTERMLPLLEQSSNGHLVNIASMAGRLGQVSAERQAQFASPTLTTEKLTALADEFAKDVVSVAVDSYLGEECGETAFVRVE